MGWAGILEMGRVGHYILCVLIRLFLKLVDTYSIRMVKNANNELLQSLIIMY